MSNEVFIPGYAKDRPLWIIGDRQSGKTTKMIEMAHDENLYIIVPDHRRAINIQGMAREMGKNILFPISLRELPFKMRGNAYCMTHDGVLVDDADAILNKLIGMPVIAATSGGVVQVLPPSHQFSNR